MFKMDLLSSYHSDSDDSPEGQEYSNEVYSKTSKSSEYSNNVDYFNLDYSSSDDDCKTSGAYKNTVNTMSLILSDKPYGPQRCSTNTSNSYDSFKQNDPATSYSLNKSEIYKVNIPTESENSYHNRNVSNAVTIKCMENFDVKSDTDIIPPNKNCDNSEVPSKKQKTDDSISRYINDDNLNSGDFSSSPTKHSEEKNSKIGSGRKISSSLVPTEEYVESVPRGLPKKQVATFTGHSAVVTALRWGTPMQSHLLLSASLDSSLKIWDIMNIKMVQDIKISSSRIKSAQWMPCGTTLICGGFDKSVHVVDISSGEELRTFHLPSYVYSIEMHPVSQHMFVAGVKDTVLAFDSRNNVCDPIRKYESRCGQVLDIKFLKEDGSEFICSTEIVSGDSSDRTIMAWDFASGALLSNQIFHERYTCPFLQVDPSYQSFVAQTNGNYIAVFSAKRPYKMDKNKRYESHKVSGYPVGLDFSTSGKFLASGDAEGGLYIYWNYSSNLITRQVVKPGVPTTQVKWNPYSHTTMATSSWDGDVQLWQ